MPAPFDSQRQPAGFDPRLLEQLAQLACPVCFGALHLASSRVQIVCVECGRAYPLIEGIPVLIADRGMFQKPE